MDSGDKYELFHKDFLCLYAYLLLESKKIVFVGFVLVVCGEILTFLKL